MKICMVGMTHPIRGGISHYTTRLCEELKKKHEIVLFSFSRLYPQLIFPGTSQYDVKSKKKLGFKAEHVLDTCNPLTWFKTAALIKKEKPDLVIYQFFQPYFAPIYNLISGKLKDTKQIFICHNVMPHERTLVDGTLSKMAFKHIDRFIVQSKKDLKDLKSLKPKSKIILNHHPIYDVFKAKGKLKKIAKRVILFFGYVRKYKGLRYLVKAMPEIAKKTGAKLLVVGEFYEDIKEYETLIKELGIDKNITIINRYVPNEDIPKYYKMADAVIVPYITATQSGIIQTAYNFDKPVVVTDVGGLPEVVDNGKTGYIVKSKDADALSKAIIKLYNNKTDYTKNIRQYKKRFSWSNLAKNLEAL